MESNAHKIIEYKPKKYSQFFLLVGNQKKIFLSCIHIYFHFDVKKIWSGGGYLISVKQIHVKSM